jgi:hypothetical protein
MRYKLTLCFLVFMRGIAMSEEAIYIVSNSNPEGVDCRYVIGPAVPDWKAYCQSLAGDMAARAIEVATKGNKDAYGHLNTYNASIWEGDMADSLVFVLLQKGYRKINFPAYDFNGEAEDDPNYKLVGIHNLQVDISDYEERIRDALSKTDVDKERCKWQRSKIVNASEKIKNLGGTPKVDTALTEKLNKLIGE